MKHSLNNFFVFTIAILSFSSCVNKISEDKNDNLKFEESFFDFSTLQSVKLNLDFGYDGYVSLIRFYASYPYISNDKTGEMELNDSLNPFYSVYTDKENKVVGNIQMPSMYDSVYVVADPLILSDALKLSITNGELTYEPIMEYTITDNTKSVFNTRVINGFDSDFYTIYAESRFEFYGLYNKYRYYHSTGDKYSYNNKKTDVYERIDPSTLLQENNSNSSITDLLTRLETTIDYSSEYHINNNNEDKVRSGSVINMKVLPLSEGTEINLYYLKSYTSYGNAFGYYYYKSSEGEPSASELEHLPKFFAIPCFNSSGPRDIVKIKLQYFGSEGNQKASTIFPAGTTIGWFVLPRTIDTNFKNSITEVKNSIVNAYNNKHALYSNESANSYGKAFIGIYDASSETEIISFQGDAYEASSVSNKNKYYRGGFFCIRASNPDAVENLVNAKNYAYSGTYEEGQTSQSLLSQIGEPIKEKDTLVTQIEEGIFASEDTWPNGGDYDLNDVIVHYETAITFNQNNSISKIVHTIIPKHSTAQNKNALGLIIDDNIGIGNIDEANSHYAKKEESNQFIIYNNHKLESAKNPIDTFKIVRVFSKGEYPSMIDYQRNYNPFIIPYYEDNENLRIEIHLPKMEGSSKSSNNLSTNDSREFYVDDTGKYPFAIDLIEAKDFVNPYDTKSIDRVYKNFSNWVNENGTKNKDWYLEEPVLY